MEDITTCQICCIKYDENCNTPRNLNCGHTYCQSCIKKCLTRNRVKCFTCRQTTTIEKAEDLPKNYVLIQLLDTIPKQQKQKQEEKKEEEEEKIQKQKIPFRKQSKQEENEYNPYNKDKTMIYMGNISPNISKNKLYNILSNHIAIDTIVLNLNSQIGLQCATIKTKYPEQKQLLWKCVESDRKFKSIFQNKPYIVYAKSQEQIQKSKQQQFGSEQQQKEHKTTHQPFQNRNCNPYSEYLQGNRGQGRNTENSRRRDVDRRYRRERRDQE